MGKLSVKQATVENLLELHSTFAVRCFQFGMLNSLKGAEWSDSPDMRGLAASIHAYLLSAAAALGATVF